jgi:hypothetical protein
LRIFINSIPKSGTNLVIRCLELLGMKERGHIGSAYLLGPNLRHKITRIVSYPFSSGYLVGIILKAEMNRFYINRKLKRVRNNEFVSGHVGYTDKLLNRILELDYKTIHIIRDPRAVIASQVPFILSTSRHPLNKMFNRIEKKQCYEKIFRGDSSKKFNLQSIKTQYEAIKIWTESKETLIIKFEDLIGSSGGGSDEIQRETIADICNHIGISTKNIDYVIENLFGSKSRTFRKGRIDSWKDEIPIELLAEIDKELESIIENFGYK